MAPEPSYPSRPSGGFGQSPSMGGPTGPGFSRRDFITAYADMVAQTWIDDQYLDLLLASPAEVLARAGIPTAPGATIRIIQVKLTGMGKVEDQVNSWIEGNRTGLYDLWLPLKPDDIDLSPGGGDPNACAGGASCCCTPCCCCGKG